jgi:hypothetical protein
MSSRNDNSEAGFALAMVGAGFVIVGAILFALAAFVALILTILCIFAWSKPLKLGNMIIEPWEARAFVGGGVAGMWLLPVFALFCEVLFQFGIADCAWTYLFLGGYVAGAFGSLWFVTEQSEQQQAAANTEVVTLPEPRPTPLVIDQQPAQPYRFASWDDEEELK